MHSCLPVENRIGGTLIKIHTTEIDTEIVTLINKYMGLEGSGKAFFVLKRPCRCKYEHAHKYTIRVHVQEAE